jgi:hypothetical protein
VICTDAHHCHINVRITANETGIKCAPICQRHPNASRTIHHVGVCEDLTVRSKNEARTKATTKLWQGSIPVVASTLALYINAYNSRPNTLGCRRDGM